MRVLANRPRAPFGAGQHPRTPKISARRSSSSASASATSSTSSTTSSTTSTTSSSRRDLLLQGASAAALLAAARPAWADEAEAGTEQVLPAAPAVASSVTAASGQQVYLDVSVEGKPLGRIMIALDQAAAPVGAARFADLAVGVEGVGYRLSKFDGIFATYIRNEGVKSLSYNALGTSRIAGGDSVQALEEELAASSQRHDAAGLVSILVREPEERPVKERLVAMGGKLVTLREQAGEAPNGTSFMITTAATPKLDATNLVVGRVVDGMDVVQALAALPFARPRDSLYDKPFFEAGKVLGDKRATVAEKRFNRPLRRVLVASAGVVN